MHHLHSNPNINAHSRIKRIAPSEKMAIKFKNIDCVDFFSFFLLKILKRLRKPMTKIMKISTIPNNNIYKVPLSIVGSKIFHDFNRFYNFINVIKNYYYTYYLYCA